MYDTIFEIYFTIFKWESIYERYFIKSCLFSCELTYDLLFLQTDSIFDSFFRFFHCIHLRSITRSIVLFTKQMWTSSISECVLKISSPWWSVENLWPYLSDNIVFVFLILILIYFPLDVQLKKHLLCNNIHYYSFFLREYILWEYTRCGLKFLK